MRRIITDFAEWEAGTRDFYDTRLLEPDRPFQAECSVFQQSDLILTDSRFPSVAFDRDPDRIHGVNNDFLLFQRYEEGDERGLLEDVPTHATPDNVHLIDMSRRYVAVARDAWVKAVIIPHSVVGFDPQTCPSYVSLPSKSPRGRLLCMAHTAMFDAVAASNPDAEELCAAFCALIRTIVLKNINHKAQLRPNGKRKLEIADYIDQHLADPDLSVEKIIQDTNISRSSLYRLFADHGGIARYIVERRLDRCLADLSGSEMRRGQVRQVAERWGFFDSGNFSRSFYERFGARPSDCTGIGVTVANDLPNDRSALQEWMRRA